MQPSLEANWPCCDAKDRDWDWIGTQDHILDFIPADGIVFLGGVSIYHPFENWRGPFLGRRLS